MRICSVSANQQIEILPDPDKQVTDKNDMGFNGPKEIERLYV